MIIIFIAHGMVPLNELHFGSSSTTAPSESSGTVSSPRTPKRILRERIFSANDVKTKQIQNVLMQRLADCEISAKEVRVNGGNIGAGSFGTVYRGFWHVPVAIKVFNVSNQCPGQTKTFQREVAVLSKIR